MKSIFKRVGELPDYFAFRLFGRGFCIFISKFGFKVMHDRGSFGYYSGQGFFKHTIK